MDVTCERCGTEYEFDETLVSDRGTTVKCTNCGHLFKVFRPGAGPSAADRNWSIRKRDGTTMVLASLRELQKLITKGELTEDDEISRSNEGWKPLGSIAELQTFFAAARAERSGGSAAPTRRDSTLPFSTGPAASPNPFGKSPSAAPPPHVDPRAYARTEEINKRPNVPPPPSRGSHSAPLSAPPPAGPPPRSAKGTIMGVGTGSTPPPPRSAKGTIMGVGGSTPPASASSPPPHAIPPPAGVPRAEPSGGPLRKATPAPRNSITRPEAPDSTRDDRPGREIAPTRTASGPGSPSAGRAASERPPRGRAPSSRPAPARRSDRPGRALYLDEEEEVPLRPAKKGRAGLWLAVVIVLLAGGGVALAWERIAPMLGFQQQDDPLAAFLERGDAELAKDHPDAYERAILEYTRGTAIAERDPGLLARIARAHALLAQALDFEADDLEARASEDPALAGEASALRREQRQHVEEARRMAEDAVRQDPNNLYAVVTLADALRLSGDAPGARSHLDRAAALEPEISADRLRVEALLAMEQAEGDPSAAGESAAAAVQAAPSLVRARLLYARALLADGSVAQARGQIDAVLRDHPQHPSALHLRDAIEQGLPPAAPVVAVLDGGVADAGTAGEEEPAEVAEADTRRSNGRGRGAAVPTNRDYSWYIRSGDQALERGDVGRARVLFEAALEKRSGGAEALNGLGYVLLETGPGGASAAAAKFRQAASQGYAPAYIGLGEALRTAGQNAQAAEAYRSYLERLPSGGQASIARRQLAALGQSEDEPSPGPSGGGGPEPEEGGSGDDDATPPTSEGTLPAPQGTDPADPPPSSDPPAVGSEP